MSFQVLSRKGKKDSVLCCVVAGIRIRVLMSAKMHYFLPNLKCLAFTLSFLAISQHRPFSSTICFTSSDLHVGMCRTFICKNTSFLMELGVGCWSRDEAWETWKPNGKKGKKKKPTKPTALKYIFIPFWSRSVFVVTVMWLIQQTCSVSASSDFSRFWRRC